jgi:molecular chaperone GrpE
MTEKPETTTETTEPQQDGAAAGGEEKPEEAENEKEKENEKDPLEEARAEAARLKDALMRTAADFDNFRKRTRREIDDARKAGREELLKDLLPVFDNLERAIQSAQRASDIKSMADGVSMVLRQFVDTLGRSGITRVPTVGSPFDPQIHDAIQQVETDEHPPGTVVAEVQPGWMQGERLVRAAMVVVSKPKAEGPKEGPS